MVGSAAGSQIVGMVERSADPAAAATVQRCARLHCMADLLSLQGDLFADVGASVGGLVQQAQQGAQQLGDALKRGKIVSAARPA